MAETPQGKQRILLGSFESEGLPPALRANGRELAAEGSVEASIAEPCNAESDAKPGNTDTGGFLEEVCHRNKRSTGRQRGKAQRGLAGSFLSQPFSSACQCSSCSGDAPGTYKCSP